MHHLSSNVAWDMYVKFVVKHYPNADGYILGPSTKDLTHWSRANGSFKAHIEILSNEKLKPADVDIAGGNANNETYWINDAWEIK